MLLDRYPLLNEPGKTMVIFERDGKFVGQVLKNRTEKAPAKLLTETKRYDTIDELIAEYPKAPEAEEASG